MTPSGHAGAGIIAAYVIERCVFKNEVAPVTLGLSALLGLLPDLDSLAVLAKRRGALRGKLRHHEFFTHTPLFYLILTALVWVLGSPRLAMFFGGGVFSHLLLDSWGTDDGIMWLWPFDRQQFALFPRNLHAGGVHGLRFYRRHVRCARVFVPEVALLLLSCGLAVHTLSLA